MIHADSRSSSRFALGVSILAALLGHPSPVEAQVAPSPSVAAAPAGVASAAAPKPSPYSLPWQVRSVVPATAFRSDTIVGASTDPVSGGSATTVASVLALSFKLTPEIAAFLRSGFVVHTPAKGQTASPLLNPALGGVYAFKVTSELRLAFMAAAVLPVGQGGGDAPDAADAAALKAGVATRSGFDSPLFGVNDLTLVAGADLAYIAHGLTVQLEVTVSEALRLRGAAAQKDSAKTNSGVGLHVGYFLLPELSVGGEIRMQRFLSTPKAVETNESLRDQITFAVGPRYHVHIDDFWVRPGLSYGRGIDDPLGASETHLVQIDIPIAF